MPTRRIQLGKDTWAGTGLPNLNHNGDQKLRLMAPGGNTNYAWIRQGIKLPDGAVVSSATLTVYSAGASSGARTLSAQRVAAGWQPGGLTWNNKPGVVGSAATAAVNVLADGDPIVFTLTNQINTIVNGAANYGFRISTTGTTAHRIYGFDSDYPPVLTIIYSIPPSQPTGLVPSGASVATNLPVLSWPYVDPDGSNLDAVKVQIDAANNFVSGVDFDSGWVSSEVSELDLTGTAYAGLANLATTYWRAQVRDQDGGESEWSDSVSFTRTDQGTLAISAPAGATITDDTPTITWALTGATQAFWMVRVKLADHPQTEVYSTGKRSGTTTSHTLPEGVIDDEGVGYIIEVTAWDNVARQAVPGFPTFKRTTATVTVADGAAGAPSALTAVPDANNPSVVLTWTATAPDTFTIVRDGKVVKALLDPADALVSGSTYTYTDWTASPLTEHSYAVRRVVAGDQSPKCAPATATTNPAGVWLVDNSVEPARWIVAHGTDVAGWARTDTYALHRPLGSAAPVKITSAMGGLDGTFAGDLCDESFVTVPQMIARYNLMLARPDRTLRLVAGHLNIPVVVADLSVGVHEFLFNDLDKASCSWTFWQVGEFGFKVPA